MKHLILVAAATGLLFTSAIALERTVGANGQTEIKLAMGPVSAPQKRSGADYPADRPSNCGQYYEPCPKLFGTHGRRGKAVRN